MAAPSAFGPHLVSTGPYTAGALLSPTLRGPSQRKNSGVERAAQGPHRVPRSEVGLPVLAPGALAPHGITPTCSLDRSPRCFSKCVPLLSFIFYLYWLLPLASSHAGVFNLYKLPLQPVPPHPTILQPKFIFSSFPLYLNPQRPGLCLPTPPPEPLQPSPLSQMAPSRLLVTCGQCGRSLPLSDPSMLDAWTVN